MTLAEAESVLRDYPSAGWPDRLLSYSPRPFSAASVVETSAGKVFLKRHHRSIRNREALLEEHRFMDYLAGTEWPAGSSPVLAPLLRDDGDSVTTRGDWTYEVHPVAKGLDLYEQALSWTPFISVGHAHAAGNALARLHLAAQGYEAPARLTQQLVASATIFCSHQVNDPTLQMEAYLKPRPLLCAYAEQRRWQRSFDEFFLPLHRKLSPWLAFLRPLWTHNDFHASNLMWTSGGGNAEVTAIVDFGLADRTNAVHDLAVAIERNMVEWLRIDDPQAELVHFNHMDALLAGYEELLPLSYEQARALAAMLPLVHCEFALSETDYFLSILNSPQKAYLAYEGYFLGHMQWFQSAAGKSLLLHLERWAEGKSGSREGGR